MDQAGVLRALASRGRGHHKTRVIAITSGKGGVGKTNISVNLSVHLALRGCRVLLVDGDFGLSNTNILLGVETQKSVDDILFGDAQFDEVIVSTHYGFDLLPGSSGVRKMLELDAFAQRLLVDKLAGSMERYDFVIFDTAPGIANHVLTLNSAAHDTVVITHPEPMAVTDAYALIKVLEQERKLKKFRLLINRARDGKEGMDTFKKLTDVSQEFLACSVDYLGALPEDIYVWHATRKQVPVVALYPASPFAVSLERICDKLLHEMDRAPVRAVLDHMVGSKRVGAL